MPKLHRPRKVQPKRESARNRHGGNPARRPSADIPAEPVGPSKAQPVTALPAGPKAVATVPPQRPWLWYLAIGSIALLLVVFGFSAFQMVTTIEEQNQKLVVSSRAFREANNHIIELRNELTRKDDLLRILSAREIVVTYLRGTGSHRGALGKMLWDPSKRTAILHVENLSPVPEGKEYQIWLLRGGRDRSAGVFTVAGRGSTMFRIDSLPVLSPRGKTTIAVTLERKGGALHPEGPVCLTGTAVM
jgi:hypothetical protein